MCDDSFCRRRSSSYHDSLVVVVPTMIRSRVRGQHDSCTPTGSRQRPVSLPVLVYLTPVETMEVLPKFPNDGLLLNSLSQPMGPPVPLVSSPTYVVGALSVSHCLLPMPYRPPSQFVHVSFLE